MLEGISGAGKAFDAVSTLPIPRKASVVVVLTSYKAASQSESQAECLCPVRCCIDVHREQEHIE